MRAAHLKAAVLEARSGVADRSVTLLHGPLSPEDQLYYAATPRSALSLHDVMAALDRIGVRARAIDVVECPRWVDELDRPDVVLPMLHGAPGEDGTIQRVLESRHQVFVGAGSTSAEQALDKILASRVARDLGVNTPREGAELCLVSGGSPLVVKPRFGGSSIGVRLDQQRVVAGPDEIVQEYIAGADVTVTVVEIQGQAVAIAGVVLSHSGGIYTLDAKLGLDTPAAVEPGASPDLSACEAAAVLVHEGLGVRDLSRVDFRLTPDAGYFLELNTMPGLSTESNAAECARAGGLRYDDLVALIVWSAVRRATGLA